MVKMTNNIILALPITRMELAYIKNTLEDLFPWATQQDSISIPEEEALRSHYEESLNIINKILEFKEVESE